MISITLDLDAMLAYGWQLY